MKYELLVKDFVEGKLSYDSFHTQVLSDDMLAQWIDEILRGRVHCYTKATKENHFKSEEVPFSIRYLLEETSWRTPVGSIAYRNELHATMWYALELKCPEMHFVPDKSYNELLDLSLDVCPEYIDGPEVWESGIIDHIIEECPTEFSKTKKIKWIKSRIKESFYITDRKYPRWIQSPDWPFSDGKPMKFVKTTVK